MLVALLAEGVDRNIMDTVIDNTSVRSPSSRRAWIEIVPSLIQSLERVGSPSSRRAWIEIRPAARRWRPAPRSPSSRRAWIEIATTASRWRPAATSPSSRRAWIEMDIELQDVYPAKVALLAEGVDRNKCGNHAVVADLRVALLAEGVDRNNQVPRLDITRSRRPPRGGRG